MRCHYEVLGLQLDATVDDIKKAYRKCALQWHPDKHADNKEEANKRFLEIQEAYETLSNDQERAWYDSHREVIINGGVPGEPGSENYLFNIFPYFSPTCFKGYGDDEKGFYTIYREMFIKIAEEDRPYFEEKIDFPDFGKSDSDYEQIVGPFYSFWLSYCTPRSFVWVEKHDTREANDRYVRRLMEKENKKLRDKAKKERNEEIRKIVEHVRKRDKRVEQYKKILEEKALLAQKKVKDKKEAERLKRIEQLKNSDYDWSAIDRHLEELELEEKRKMKQKSKKFTNEEEVEEGEEEEEDENLDKEMDDLDEEDESDFDDSLYCVACDKSFKSTKSFKNHENSKKHKENVELLKKHMKEEDESLFKDEDKETEREVEEEQVTEEEEEMFQTKTKLSKKQKKKRNKQNRFEAELNELSEDEDKDKEESGVKDEEIEKNESEIVEEKPIKKEKKTKNDKKKKEVKEKLVEEEILKQEEETIKPAICSVCMQEFETRNKLFDHIKQEGHAAPKQVDPNQPLSHNALKKLKRMAKAKK